MNTKPLPSAWRGGERALAVADSHGKRYRKPILVELEEGGLRLFNGAKRTWYVYTKHRTDIRADDKEGYYFTSIHEEDLRELDGGVRVDRPFLAFLERLNTTIPDLGEESE